MKRLYERKMLGCFIDGMIEKRSYLNDDWWWDIVAEYFTHE